MTMANLKLVDVACEELDDDGTLWLYGREDQAAEMRALHAQIKGLTAQLNAMKREVRAEVRELVEEAREAGQHVKCAKIDAGDEKPVQIDLKSQWKALPADDLPEGAEHLFTERLTVKCDDDITLEDLECFMGEDGWRRLQSVATISARVKPTLDYPRKRFLSHARMGADVAAWLDEYEAGAQCAYAVVLG